MTGIAFPTPATLPPPGGSPSIRENNGAAGETFHEVFSHVQESAGKPHGNDSLQATAPKPGQPGTATTSKASPRSLPQRKAAADSEVPAPVRSEEEAPQASVDEISAQAVGTQTQTPPVPTGNEAPTPGPTWDPTLGTGKQVHVESKPATSETDESNPESEAACATASPVPPPVLKLKDEPAESTGPDVPAVETGIEEAPASSPKEQTTAAVVVDIVRPLPPPPPKVQPEPVLIARKPELTPGVSSVGPTEPAQESMPVPPAAVQMTIKTAVGQAAEESTAQTAEGTPLMQTAPQPQPSSTEQKRGSRLSNEDPRELVKDASVTEPPNQAELGPGIVRPAPARNATARQNPDQGSDSRSAASRKTPSAQLEVPPETTVGYRAPQPASAPVTASRTAEPILPNRPNQPAAAETVRQETLLQEPLPKAPLKTISLEFSPDGAGEVHLKLAERAGEVHVSLHSNDSTLNHQLRNGIGDLASTLAAAGYDAEAWTSSDRGGRQHREQAEQPQLQQQQGQAFELALNQSPQEVI